MASVISKRILACDYSSLLSWDYASNYLHAINTCTWSTVPLSQVAVIRLEPASDDEIQSGAVSLLDRISFDEGRVFAGKRTETKMRQYKAYKGDVVVSKINARKGAIGIVESETPVGATIHFRVLIPNNSKVLTKFLHLGMRSTYCRNQFEILTGGQGKGEISEDRLLSVTVPIPPLPIQQKIVDHWEAAKSKANADIAQAKSTFKSLSNLLLNTLGLKRLDAAHDKRAFVTWWQEIERWGAGISREMSRRPKLSDSPYPIVSLGDVIDDLQNGWSPKCLTRPAEVDEWGVLKVGAVSFGWFDESQNKALPPNLKSRGQYEVKPGNFIISRANITQYVGACALVGAVRSRLMLCDKLFRVIWKEASPILPQYLDEVLKTPHLRWQIENNLTGASPTMKNISKPALLALRFPLPPLTIQEEIIAEIEAKRKEARLLEEKAKAHHKIAALEIEEMILGTRPVEVP